MELINLFGLDIDVNICMECGMNCMTGEYHPFAACLMFKQCGSSQAVRLHLSEIVKKTKDGKITTYKHSRTKEVRVVNK